MTMIQISSSLNFHINSLRGRIRNGNFVDIIIIVTSSSSSSSNHDDDNSDIHNTKMMSMMIDQLCQTRFILELNEYRHRLSSSSSSSSILPLSSTSTTLLANFEQRRFRSTLDIEIDMQKLCGVDLLREPNVNKVTIIHAHTNIFPPI